MPDCLGWSLIKRVAVVEERAEKMGMRSMAYPRPWPFLAIMRL